MESLIPSTTIGLVICTTIVGAIHAAPEPSGKPAAGFTATVRFQGTSEVIKGLPAVVQVNVTNADKPVARLSEKEFARLSVDEKNTYLEKTGRYDFAFPDFGLITSVPPIALKVVDNDGKEVVPAKAPGLRAFWLKHPAVRERAEPLPHVSLFPGETKTFVVDIGNTIASLPPGTYQMSLVVYHDWESAGWQSAAVTVKVAEPSADIWATLEKHLPHLKREGDWLKRGWLTPNADSADLKKKLSAEAYQSLVPYLFLDGALKAGSVEKTPLEPLADFPEHLQGLAASLRYEVLLARGDAKLNEAEFEKIASKFPSLKWRAEEIKANKKAGLIYQTLLEYGDASPRKAP
jgi:hypothetical protein